MIETNTPPTNEEIIKVVKSLLNAIDLSYECGRGGDILFAHDVEAAENQAEQLIRHLETSHSLEATGIKGRDEPPQSLVQQVRDHLREFGENEGDEWKLVSSDDLEPRIERITDED